MDTRGARSTHTEGVNFADLLHYFMFALTGNALELGCAEETGAIEVTLTY